MEKPFEHKWIKFRKPNLKTRINLFCFPFGGGGASIYREWFDILPPEIALCAIQPPGRENRLNEKPFTNLSALVEAVIPALVANADKPFAIFGHSVGALVGFEVARELYRKHECIPVKFFASACKAPHLIPTIPPTHRMPEPEFIEIIQRYKGIPEKVIAEPELLEIYLPILRADFAVLETYHCESLFPLACPIDAYGGFHDKTISEKELAAWNIYTQKPFQVKMFPGDHFYLRQNMNMLIRGISRDLLSSA